MWTGLSRPTGALRAKAETWRREHAPEGLSHRLLPEYPACCSLEFRLRAAASALAWISLLLADAAYFRCSSPSDHVWFLKINKISPLLSVYLTVSPHPSQVWMHFVVDSVSPEVTDYHSIFDGCTISFTLLAAVNVQQLAFLLSCPQLNQWEVRSQEGSKVRALILLTHSLLAAGWQWPCSFSWGWQPNSLASPTVIATGRGS